MRGGHARQKLKIKIKKKKKTTIHTTNFLTQ